MNFEILAKHNVFLIPFTEKGKDRYIAYLPIQKFATECSFNEIEEACQILSGNEDANFNGNRITCHLSDEKQKIFFVPRTVDEITHMAILPNSKCNFSCSYCYSAYGRNGKELKLESLKAALEYFLDKERIPHKRLTMSILGGGEPMLSWSMLRQALDYAFELSERRHQALPVCIVSNGSVVTDDFIEYCLLHDIKVNISFDILEDVQNNQRGHYKKVVDNINHLTDRGISVAFYTVVTNENVERISEMINHMRKITPNVKKVSFKSLISNDYFISTEKRTEYYYRFIDNIFSVKPLANSLGIEISSPFSDSVLCLTDRFCPGKFVVGAENTISICHCVSSHKDVLFNSQTYAEVNQEGKVVFNKQKFSDILSHDQNFYKSCTSCEARWHCAGGCYTDMSTIGDEDRKVYCKAMKYFLKRYLINTLLK